MLTNQAEIPEWKPAKITSVFFGIEDHGLLTFDLGFEYGTTSQHLGHLGIASKAVLNDISIDGIKFVYGVIEIFAGYSDITKLVGKYCEVYTTWSKVYGLRQLRPDGQREIYVPGYKLPLESPNAGR